MYYPLWKVYVEAEIVVERIDREAALNATLLQLAVSGVLSKKGNDAFHKRIKKLTRSNH